MANKTVTQAVKRDSSVIRKPAAEAQVSRRQPTPVHPAAALLRAMSRPASELSASDILTLQRTAGNRAVAEMLAQSLPPEPPDDGRQHRLILQAKLAVGAADDPCEREADRIAAKIAQTTEPSVPRIQRQPSPDEEGLFIQRQAASSLSGVEPEVERAIERARGGGHPLPDNLRARMEQGFGADFSGVRIHSDDRADRLNRSLQSRAFTNGQDLFFKRGEYNPSGRSGQELIAHELTHVLQQGGRQGQLAAGKLAAHGRPAIKATRSLDIQSTQAQLQLQRSYRILAGDPQGNKDLWVRPKKHGENYHVTVIDMLSKDGQQTRKFKKFHITFENNTEGRNAHFYFNENGNPRQADTTESAFTKQNENYKADAQKKDSSLTPFETLEEDAAKYAGQFIDEIINAEEAEEKRKKLEAAKAALKKMLDDAKKAKHNGFKLVTKSKESKESKSAWAQKPPYSDKEMNDYKEEIKKKMPAKAILHAKPGVPELGGLSKTAIHLDIQLSDFDKEADAAYVTLKEDSLTARIDTAKLELKE